MRWSVWHRCRDQPDSRDEYAGDPRSEEIDEVYRVEENINFLNKEITNYLVHLNQASLPTSDVMRIGALFHVVNDIERIGDHAKMSQILLCR